MAPPYTLFDESNELQKVLWNASSELVKRPLLETQYFVKINVTTTHTWLEPSSITPEDGDGGECYTTRQTNPPPVVVEFPLKLFSMASTNDAFGNIDSLVSNGIISLAFSKRIKCTLSRSRLTVEKIALKKKHKWVQLILLVEVERVYFEELETKKFEKEKDVSSATSTGSCRICSGQFSTKDLITKMPCSHAFHHHCIFSWLKMRNTCPCCSFEMPKP